MFTSESKFMGFTFISIMWLLYFTKTNGFVITKVMFFILLILTIVFLIGLILDIDEKNEEHKTKED